MKNLILLAMIAVSTIACNGSDGQIKTATITNDEGVEIVKVVKTVKFLEGTTCEESETETLITECEEVRNTLLDTDFYSVINITNDKNGNMTQFGGSGPGQIATYSVKLVFNTNATVDVYTRQIFWATSPNGTPYQTEGLVKIRTDKVLLNSDGSFTLSKMDNSTTWSVEIQTL